MTGLPWTQSCGNDVSIGVELAVYPLEVVLRACHAFTARCYVFAHDVHNGIVVIDFASKDATPLRELAGEFSNALIDYSLRSQIAGETHAIRELLVAQAFCEADLLDRGDVESDEYADPRGIAR